MNQLISQKKVNILCPLCGAKFTPQFGNICQPCTLASLEEVRMLEAGDNVKYCRFCQRFQRPPWINCHRQSQQMMELLLKKVKGLNKVTFINAKFVWVQPHSKRFKLKVNFRRQVNEKTQVQQSEIVQFIEVYTQCQDCKKNFTPHDWNTVIQVRQMINHKKTFLALQQNILKQKFAQKVLKIQPSQHGVDFYFKSQNDSTKYVDYIKSNLPILLKNSKQLISHNERDNTSNIKTTYSLTIPKICKDDLVKIPSKLCKEFGNCSPMLLCMKISKSLYFMEITNFKKIIMSSTQYFLYEDLIQIFVPKIYSKQYLVLNNEGARNQETHNVYATYGLSITQGPQEIFVRSQLNLDCDTEVLGYDLTETEDMQGKNTPDIVLFKKIKRKQQQKQKQKVKKEVSAREKVKNQKLKKEKQLIRKGEQKIQKKKQQEAEKQQNNKDPLKKEEQKEENEWEDYSDDQELEGEGFSNLIQKEN